MGAKLIPLTVRSQDGQVIDPTIIGFEAEKMSEVLDNMNPLTAQSVTKVGDAGNQLTLWYVWNTPDILYYALTNPATNTYVVTLYKGKQGGYPVAQGTLVTSGGTTGTIFGSPLNEEGIYFQTYLNFSAVDQVATNTVHCTTFFTERDLQLPGETQFMYTMPDNAFQDGRMKTILYTVEEDATLITGAINGDFDILTVQVPLTVGQITTLFSAPVALVPSPGTGFVINPINGFVDYTEGGAAITGNVTMDVVNTTTTTNILCNATNAFSGASSKITRLINLAGLTADGEGVSAMMNTGDPTMGVSTGNAKITLNYFINEL
jgi:hypothetical protein